MAIIRRGTVARPGIHRRLDGTEEVVTAQELKEAAMFQNRIPLVLKHPAKGHIDPSDRVGTVNQWWNEKEQKIDGEFWFYEEPEYWHKIPLRLRTLIRNLSKTIKTMSGGYNVPKEKWEGDYKPRHWDHIAIDELNPMQDIGIEKGDLRMESELPDNFRIEETPEITGEKKEETPSEPEPAESQFELGMKLGELKAENKALRERLEKLEKRPVIPEKVEEEVKVTEEATEPEPPKPKTVVPRGSAKKEDSPDEDGQFRITA